MWLSVLKVMCAGFILREVRIIKRLKMQQQLLTLEQGCELHLQDCRHRNLREATMKHYQQSYKQLFKFFDTDMPLKQMTQDKYQGYIIYLSKQDTVLISSRLTAASPATYPMIPFVPAAMLPRNTFTKTTVPRVSFFAKSA